MGCLEIVQLTRPVSWLPMAVVNYIAFVTNLILTNLRNVLDADKLIIAAWMANLRILNNGSVYIVKANIWTLFIGLSRFYYRLSLELNMLGSTQIIYNLYSILMISKQRKLYKFGACKMEEMGLLGQCMARFILINKVILNHFWILDLYWKTLIESYVENNV